MGKGQVPKATSTLTAFTFKNRIFKPKTISIHTSIFSLYQKRLVSILRHLKIISNDHLCTLGMHAQVETGSRLSTVQLVAYTVIACLLHL